MQVVTFETAKRLKEAGFPNPEILNNKFWFITDHEKPLFVEYFENILECIRMKFNPIFAPSATDILPKLYTGVTDGTEWAIVFRGKNWSCVLRQWNEQGQSVDAWYHSENPAEACAAAWLDKNENACFLSACGIRFGATRKQRQHLLCSFEYLVLCAHG